ncbi:Hypothetical protein FKW44_024431, partial [Caligus rogercresseyi]
PDVVNIKLIQLILPYRIQGSPSQTNGTPKSRSTPRQPPLILCDLNPLPSKTQSSNQEQTPEKKDDELFESLSRAVTARNRLRSQRPGPSRALPIEVAPIPEQVDQPPAA